MAAVAANSIGLHGAPKGLFSVGGIALGLPFFVFGVRGWTDVAVGKEDSSLKGPVVHAHLFEQRPCHV